MYYVNPMLRKSLLYSVRSHRISHFTQLLDLLRYFNYQYGVTTSLIYILCMSDYLLKIRYCLYPGKHNINSESKSNIIRENE